MISIDDITKRLEEKGKQDIIPQVLNAYTLASVAHDGIYRESGEPYITHPLNVCKNLLDMEIYDANTLSAALLHDVVEDTNISLFDISTFINQDTAMLVDGVTKISRLNFSNKENQNLANTRKIINGLNKDVRIIIIKLADRLHNMNTLEFKRREKQIENAEETLQLFVPLAISIGAHTLKNELEDLSLMYLEPDEYKKIEEQKLKLYQEFGPKIREMSSMIDEILNNKNIPHHIKYRTRNIYDTYKKLLKGYKMENIYDLYYLKVIVDTIDNCYLTLCSIHSMYPPINSRFKDYIYNPKTNFYQSLHTTVSYDDKIIKAKIRTKEMDHIAAYGVSGFWNIPNGKTIEETQEDIRKRSGFAKKLFEIDQHTEDNRTFYDAIKEEVLIDHVYPYTESGEIIELPKGSTIIDFAFEVNPDLAEHMTGALVNGKEVPFNYKVQNHDTIQIIAKGIPDRTNWEEFAYNMSTKLKIKEKESK